MYIEVSICVRKIIAYMEYYSVINVLADYCAV